MFVLSSLLNYSKIGHGFCVKAGKVGGAKCVEVKRNKVESGACYVKYEVVLKSASGSNVYSEAGYNIGEMTMCSSLTFSSVTDVQLTVSFKPTSRHLTVKSVTHHSPPKLQPH